MFMNGSNLQQKIKGVVEYIKKGKAYQKRTLINPNPYWKNNFCNNSEV